MKFILYIFILSFTFELSAQFTKDDIFSCTISYQIQCLDVGKEYLRRVREGESMDKDGFNKIRQINFYGLEDIKPEEFERLTEFKNLTHFHYNNGNPNDKHLKYIGKLTWIKDLALSEAKITNKGMKQLKDLKNLEYLDLENVKISGKSMPTICNFSKLKKLDLYRSKVNSKGLSCIGNLQNLKSINLDFTRIDNKAIDYIIRLKNLEGLSMGGMPKINYYGIRKLPKLKKLKTLQLRYNSISKKSMHEIAKIQSLSSFAFTSDYLKPGTIRILKKKHPHILLDR